MFATRLNISSFFFFNDTATSEIYTLSLHDALPICNQLGGGHVERRIAYAHALRGPARATVAGHLVGRPLLDDDLRAVRDGDRKSTRLNSSHSQISYAVFCLKKKKSSRRRRDVLFPN